MVEESTKKLSSDELTQEFGAVGKITDMLQYIQNEILDNRTVTLEQLIFMTRNDGNARGLLNAIKYPLKMSRAKIEPPEKGGVAETAFIKKNLLGTPGEGGMSVPMSTIVARMSLAVRDGYKIFEKVWKVYKGKLWLDRLAYRSTLSTKFKYDGHGNITGAKQEYSDIVTGEFKTVPFDLNKIVYFIYNAEENPYMGESAFLPCFYHYDKKHKLYAVSHLAYQLNAVPIRVGYHPKSLRGDDLVKFREALVAMGTSVALTMPETCKIEPFESGRKLTEFLPLIQHHDTQMRTSFLAQFMGAGQDGGGGFTLSQDQSNLFLMSLMGLLEDISHTFNHQVIPQLIDWNFGTYKYPKLVFTPFSDTLRSAVMETFRSLLAARFPNVSEAFVLKLEELISEELGMELNYELIRKQREEERAILKQAAGTDESTGEQNGSILPEGNKQKHKKGLTQTSLGNVAPGGGEELDEDL